MVRAIALTILIQTLNQNLPKQFYHSFYRVKGQGQNLSLYVKIKSSINKKIKVKNLTKLVFQNLKSSKKLKLGNISVLLLK